jgi:hypothetical protein
MRLLGPLNWWAPRGVKSWVARLGFYEEPRADLRPEVGTS